MTSKVHSPNSQEIKGESFGIPNEEINFIEPLSLCHQDLWQGRHQKPGGELVVQT
jgi:hypothetical protein